MSHLFTSSSPSSSSSPRPAYTRRRRRPLDLAVSAQQLEAAVRSAVKGPALPPLPSQVHLLSEDQFRLLRDAETGGAGEQLLLELAGSLKAGPLLDPATVGDKGPLPGHGGGLSGVTFLFTSDRRFIFKQVRNRERQRLSALVTALIDYHRRERSNVEQMVVIPRDLSPPRSVPGIWSVLPTLFALVAVRGVGTLLPMRNIFWEGSTPAVDAERSSGSVDGGGAKGANRCFVLTETYDLKGSASRYRPPQPPRRRMRQPPLMEQNFCLACQETQRLRRQNGGSGGLGSTWKLTTTTTTTSDTTTPQQEGQEMGQCHRTLRMGQEQRQLFLGALQRDTALLASRGLMDYSLLLAVRRRTKTTEEGGEMEEEEAELYDYSLIDILAEYGLAKQLDAAWRIHVLGQDRRGVSSLEPQQYATRLVRFMELHTE
jgi:hypothetical protein